MNAKKKIIYDNRVLLSNDMLQYAPALERMIELYGNDIYEVSQDSYMFLIRLSNKLNYFKKHIKIKNPVIKIIKLKPGATK